MCVCAAAVRPSGLGGSPEGKEQRLPQELKVLVSINWSGSCERFYLVHEICCVCVRKKKKKIQIIRSFSRGHFHRKFFFLWSFTAAKLTLLMQLAFCGVPPADLNLFSVITATFWLSVALGNISPQKKKKNRSRWNKNQRRRILCCRFGF